MNTRIVVGEGSCGLAAGAGAVYSALEEKLTGVQNATLSITGCIGICYLEPIRSEEHTSELQSRI